jgi:Ca-activated chloride channel homolog
MKIDTRSWTRGISLAALFAVLAVAPLRAQQPIPPPDPPEPPDVDLEQAVELSANLVTVTVVVRDASGALVTDLTPSDFAIYEEGKRQDVDRFYRQGEVPLRLALLFDASLSVKERLDFEKRAASRFVTSVIRPGDQVALVSVATEWRIEQALTGSAGALVDATNRLEAGGITSLYAAIQGTSKYLGEVQGRHVMLVLSDGYDTKGRETLKDTLEVAQRNDIVIYGISPAGAGDDATAAGRIGAEALRQLCEDTGGRAFYPPFQAKPAEELETLNRIYTRIVEELHGQYVLTYYSNAPAVEGGRFRSLRVEVSRPGVTATARKGYYAK